MKRLLVFVALVVAVVKMLPSPSQAQTTSSDTNVVAALDCGGPAPVLGQLTSLIINGVPATTGGPASLCSDTTRVTSFEPAGTDLGPSTCGAVPIAAGFAIPEAQVRGVSATVSVGAGPNPPTTPVVCTGSHSSLPLMITCDDIVNHLHLHLIVR